MTEAAGAQEQEQEQEQPDTAARDDAPPVPSLFADVVGQPAAVAALRAAARHPVHAYLFTGPSGAGPQAAVFPFAASLLCPRHGCGSCRTCRRALEGTHPDLVVVSHTGASLGVDDARKLVGMAQRRPFEAARQVLVVTDVHLAARSVPALLKTVEEPPPSTVFVLLADEVPPELVTVASRCVEVPFPPLRAPVVAEWLMARGVAGDRARLVAEGAGGDLDRARLLADDEAFAARLALWRDVPARLDGLGASAGELARRLLAEADSALGPLRERHAAELAALAAEAESLGERGASGRREVADRQRREERRWRTQELRVGLGVLAHAYRDRLADVVAAGAVGRGDDEIEGYLKAVETVSEASRALRRNPQETLLLEALLVRLARLGG